MHPGAAIEPIMGTVAGHGLRLNYREWPGDGVPVVLLHGVTGSSADWMATARGLHGRRLLALDARGHGDSGWDPEEGYAGDHHFADVATALDGLGIERCHLAGFSMGGGVAMMTAAALPERVQSLTVVDSYPQPTMTPGSRRIAGWVSRFSGGTAWFDPAIARRFAEQLEAGNENRLDLWPLWEAIECPALIIRGEESDVLPASVAAEMLARLRGSRLHSIAGVAHGIPYVRPAELASVLRDFVAAHDG